MKAWKCQFRKKIRQKFRHHFSVNSEMISQFISEILSDIISELHIQAFIRTGLPPNLSCPYPDVCKKKKREMGKIYFREWSLFTTGGSANGGWEKFQCKEIAKGGITQR